MTIKTSSFEPKFDNPYLKGLIYGLRWNAGVTVTYKLAASDVDADGVSDWSEAGLGDGIRKAYAAWGAVIPIKFKEVKTGAADFTENVVAANSLGGAAANHSYPFSGGTGNYELYDFAGDKPRTQPGGYYFQTLLHEIGHGIGLSHSHGDRGDPFPGVENAGDRGDHGLNDGLYTVMSYTSLSGSGSEIGVLNYGGTKTPMAFDIAAAQAVYGRNMATAKGDTVWTLPTENKAGIGFACIWDAGGTDTIVNAGNGDATIDLRAATLKDEEGGGGLLSKVGGIYGGFTIANGVVIENANGGGGRDTIIGNAAKNALKGGAGDDILTGGIGADTLTGGKGADRFVIGIGESVSGKADRIADFEKGTDLLDVDALRLTSAKAGYRGGVTSISGKGLYGDLAVTLTGKFSLKDLGIDDQIGAIRGTTGRNVLNGSKGDDLVWALAGHDKVNGKEGHDKVYGDTGNDTLLGGDGNDTLDGGAGKDSLVGGAGDDQLFGGAGDDRLNPGLGNGTVDGGDGIDTLVIDWGKTHPSDYVEVLGGHSAKLGYGGPLANVALTSIEAYDITVGNGGSFVSGGKLGDRLTGGNGIDWLDGNEGDDTLIGGAGDDHLDGNAGSDVLTGGGGADRFDYWFFWGSDPAKLSTEKITDFARAQGDRIDLSRTDAVWGWDANEAFAFVGTKAFSGAAGELHYVIKGNETFVTGDVDGDKLADFEIVLSGKIKLIADDFIL